MRILSTIAAVAAAMACATAPAAAGTVSMGLDRIEVPKSSPYQRGRTTWTAAPGEANRLTVTFGEHGEVVLRDVAAPLAAGAGCRTLADGAVACTPPDGLGNVVVADAGDGGDAITVSGTAALATRVHAGAGDDRVESLGPQLEADGGPGADLLAGGDARDWLEGGDGPDELRGGGGDDHLRGDDRGGPFAADQMDGGAGAGDHSSYVGRSDGVVVDLVAGSGGAPGEEDLLTGVENVTGGDGADVLRGDDGPNRLDAGAGGHADAVDGRGGEDRLDVTGPWGANGPAAELNGGDGDDVLVAFGRTDVDGGAGADRLWGKGTSMLGCGPGRDRVRPLVAAVVVVADCEQVDTSLFLLSGIRATGRRLAVTFAAGPYPVYLPGSCGAEVVVRAGGRVLGSTTARIPEQRRRRLRLVLRAPLPATARIAIGLVRCQESRHVVERREGRDSFLYARR